MPERKKLLSPVDTHVHLRDPGATHKEDFKTGTMAAVAGGYTTILDMPNNPKVEGVDYSTTTLQRLEEKRETAENEIFCDVGFHFGGRKESIKYFNDIADKVFALKVYMNTTTGHNIIVNPEELRNIFSYWPSKKILMVHAEGDTLKTAIDLAKETRQRLHVCHVSQESEIKMIKSAKEKRLPITCETSAHHLFLNEKDAERLGGFGKMKPPLTKEKDRLALWDNLDVIDIIASDHAPHTREEKETDDPPWGVPGLETTLPLMLTAVTEEKLSFERLEELISFAPRRIFGIRDNLETYTEVELGTRFVIDSRKLYTKAGWTPFDGARANGRVLKTVIRGQTVFEEGKLIENPKGYVISPYPLS